MLAHVSAGVRLAAALTPVERASFAALARNLLLSLEANAASSGTGALFRRDGVDR